MTAAAFDGVDAAGRRPIRVGISACLLGEKVRFDGGHKRDTFLTETFGRFVDLTAHLARFSRSRVVAVAGEDFRRTDGADQCP